MLKVNVKPINRIKFNIFALEVRWFFAIHRGGRGRGKILKYA